VLEAQRAGEVGERGWTAGEGEACEGQLQQRCWRGGGAPAAALERGRGGAQQGLERRQAAGSQKLER
jgi:hypothetical protein